MKKHSVLFLLCASAGMMLLTGCKASPDKTVKEYFKAVKKGDEKKALELVTGSKMKKETRGKIREAREMLARKNAKFSNPVITDDTATADVTYTVTGKAYFKRVDGKWKMVSSLKEEEKEAAKPAAEAATSAEEK